MNHMRKTATILLILLFLSIYVAEAQPPPTPPCWFYGTASIDGLPAQDNLDVTATIKGTNLTWTTKTENGTYGWLQRGSTTFYIPYDNVTSPNKDGGVDGDTIEFYLNGTKTNLTATFESLDMKRVDLALGSSQVDGGDEPALILPLYGALAIVIGVSLGAVLWIYRKRRAREE